MFGKMCLLVALFVVAVSASTTNQYISKFESFKTTYSRKYATPHEEAHRFRVFVENMKEAERQAKRNPLATFGVNEFADVTAAEFKIRHNGEKVFQQMQAKRAPIALKYSEEQIKAAGSSIDWRAKGAVTYVKNQGQCGSCWSFSSTGSIEGQWFLAGNALVALSEQELVSCDTTDSGCQGGLMDNAWTWLVNNEGGNIATEASIPYVSGSGTAPACSGTGTTGATISGHIDIPGVESTMSTWMFTGGPMSIGVDATSWQTYTGGILTDCVSQQVDHGVLAVGYDLTASTPYWIVKNSWGGSWGESGYIRIGYGSNQCLITSGPCSSQVSGSHTPAPGQTPAPNQTPAPTPAPWNTPAPTPAPWNTPAPTPAPWNTPAPNQGGDFTQYNCEDFFCTVGCQENSFPQNQCLQAGSGQSVIASCQDGGLLMTAYSSSDCSGQGQQDLEPVDQCLQDTDGTYIYNVCPSSSSKKSTAPKGNAKHVELPKRLKAKLAAMK